MNKNNQEYRDKINSLLKQEYGEKCLKDPLEEWSKEKEQKFLDEYTKLIGEQKQANIHETEQLVIIDKIGKRKKKSCERCNKNVFTNRDTIYLTKHKVCEKCYVIFYEGRQ